jgi:hypothetical protein
VKFSSGFLPQKLTNPKKSFMKEKIILALQTRFAGVADAILNRVAEKLSKTVTEETQIETAVSGVTFQQVLESYGDSRANDATISAVSNYEKKHGLIAGKPLQQQQQQQNQQSGQEIKLPEDAPAWAKEIIGAMQKQNQDLTDKLSKFESKGQKEQLLSSLTTKLKGKVPASFLKGRTIEIADENQLDELATTLEADYLELKQEQINSGIIVDVPNQGNQNPGVAAVDADIKRLGSKF